MVNSCANPKCAKPLHYLREGRIFVFEAAEAASSLIDSKRAHRLEHFWLCGDCSQTMTLEKTRDGIRAISKPRIGTRRTVEMVGGAIAS